MSIELEMPSNHLILCRPLLLPPLIFLSIRVFSNESVLSIRWSKYWSFSFSISPSNENSVLISFRMDWLDLLAVRGTLTWQSPSTSNPGCGAEPSHTRFLSDSCLTTGSRKAHKNREKQRGKSLLFGLHSQNVLPNVSLPSRLSSTPKHLRCCEFSSSMYLAAPAVRAT